MRKFLKLGWIPTLLLALTISACSDESGRGELVSPEGPSASTSLSDDYKALQEGREIEYAGSAEKLIGPEGGYLYVDLHYLYVPKGAVAKPTLFRMEMLENGHVGAKMTASTPGSRTANNVGALGFRKPVYLFFNYSRATNLQGDVGGLKIGQILSNGKFAPVPTTIYREHEIAGGTLRHFSDYALAWP